MALGDPYSILGIKKDASESEIRKAYRALAKKYHPDLNQGNKAAEQRFKEITAAYDLLGDAKKRARYDRGEIDAEGHERPPHFTAGSGPWSHAHRGSGRHAKGRGAPFGDDLSSIFEGFFTQGASPFPMESKATINVPFLDAVRGGVQMFRLPSGQILNVTLPPGTAEGQVLRLQGKGEGGGDLLLTIHVLPHPYFKREGTNILLNVPLTLSEAVLGGKVLVPTLTGWVEVNIPKTATTGTVLRLRGKGVKGQGDQLLTLQIALPDKIDSELEEFLRGWSVRHAYDPRHFWKS